MTMTRDGQVERFEVSEVSRRGAHRSRPNPVTGLLPLLALAVVVLTVVGLAYVLFGRGTTATSTATGPTGGTSAGASVSVSAPGSSARATPSAQASAGASAGASSSGVVDKSVVLNFYNGSSPLVPGLSRKAATKLAAEGWKVGTVLPWDGAPVTRTTVYYGEAGQLPTARAVVKALGGGTVKLNTIKTAQGMAVVISNDFAP